LAHVVLVEDNRSISKAYAVALRSGGHQVDVAADELALRALLAQSLPDLLLLDVGLPGMDGLEILRELRQEPATAGLRVAIVSNFGDRDLVHRALKLDALEYVEKVATSPRLLLDQVNRWLER
jgi:DNA-binding response OmpR family regulator